MSVNEMSLPVRREKFALGNRVLGLLGMLGAPMLFIFFMFGNLDDSAPMTLNDLFGQFKNHFSKIAEYRKKRRLWTTALSK